MKKKTCGECKHFEVDDVAATCEKKRWICDDDAPACKRFEPKVVTNGDKIRQMSNEELAKILRMCKSCAYYGECLTDPNKNGQCYYGRLEWLNAPAKEGKDE